MISADDIYSIIPLAIILCVLIFGLFWRSARRRRIDARIARITNKKTAVLQKNVDVMSLRRKAQGDSLPFISKIISKLPTQTAIKARLERAGLEMSADRYMLLSVSGGILAILVFLAAGKSISAAVLAGLMLGGVMPYVVIGFRGQKRIKKFLILFPDAIDFIVRGLKSGLPVTESMNIVGKEMVDPVGPIFTNMGESVRLGVPVDKALQDMARKLNTTEFNFFVTSIILQRETGGNLSEILTNLSDVLRKRLMMRLKIKAMSSEAKASALIVGALPFIVILALQFISPGYLDPLMDTTKGNVIAIGSACSMLFGITVMIKMTKFEI